MAKYLEDRLQKSVATYLNYMGMTWFHVANERSTSPRTGANLKKKGVKPGIPDVIILDQKHGFNGMVIELKVGKKKPTDAQLQWLEKFETLGWKTAVCYDFESVVTLVEWYTKK